MAKISATLESKSPVNLTLEAKPASLTQNEAIMVWDDADFTWDAPTIAATLTSKTTVNLSLESK